MNYVDDYVNRLKLIQTGQALDRPVSKSDFANLILQKARSDFSVGEPPSIGKQNKSLGQKGKSFALGVLDLLARPSYAVAEAAQQGFNEGDSVGDVLKGAKEGIMGHKKTDFIDVLQTQHKNEIKDRPEYKRIQKEYGQKEADYYEESEKALVDKGDLVKDILPGLIDDFVLDPTNLVGGSVVRKPLEALRGIKSLSKEGEAIADVAPQVEDAVQSAGTQGIESVPQTTTPAEPAISPDFLEKLRQNKSTTPTEEIPQVGLPKGSVSNRRPPFKMLEGEKVTADYKTPVVPTERHAHISDVYNRDLRASDFAKLQKARIIEDTAKITDQVSKGNPAAVHLVTNKDLSPLSPVARRSVDDAVRRTVKEISESIADPAKARAVGKQPRHPILNAPTQNNLSSRLTNAARNQFKAESFAAKNAVGVKNAASPKFIPAVYERYTNMLKNAEESLIERGRSEANDAYYPRGGIKPDSPYLRLSDVLDALPKEVAMKAILGPKPADKVLPSVLLKAITGNNAALGKIAKHPDLFAAINAVDWAPMMTKEYTSRIIDASNAAHKTTEEAAHFIAAKMADGSSDSSKAQVIDDITKAAKSEFSKEMPAAKTSLNEMLDGLRKSIPHPVPNVIDDIIARSKDKLAAGVFDAKNGQKLSQEPRIQMAESATEDALKGEHGADATVRSAATDVVKADDAAEFGIFSTVLSWVKPGMGYEVLRPLVLKNIGVRRASATTRAHEIIKIFGTMPEAEHLDFWNEVRGFIDPVAGHEKAVEQMQKMFNNMFGESGLADKFAGNTSLSRAGINLDHLNKHMKIVGIHDFKFINEVPDPLTGHKLRLAGPQILDTWKNYHPTSSKALRIFAFNMTQAVENAMVEYSTFANAGALWGSKTAKAGHVAVSGMHPAIDGMYFPTEIAPQLGKVATGIDEMYKPLAGSKIIKMYDQALRTWKTGVTIYAPSHHIRNIVGDVWMSWLDGVNNPMYYTKSAQMMKANFRRYSDINPDKTPLKMLLGNEREADLVNEIIGNSKTIMPKGTRVIAKARIGRKTYKLTIDQAYQMAFRHGILPHSSVVEDLPGSETLMESLAERFHPGKVGPFAPAGGKVASGVKQFAESREHYARLAHWLHALEHTKANSLEELFQKSADRVRKFHPDGLDLTQTEKTVFRRLIPFYSWNRKAIPLILEGIVMHPAKILAYPKLMSGIQESQGVDSSIGDPFPDDQLFPDWLSGNTVGPILSPQSAFAKAIARSDDEVGYTLVDPGVPGTDILEQFGNDPVKGIGNSITPGIKIPAELMFGRDFQSGAPIDDKTQYIDKNVPLLSTISRMTNGAVGTGLAEGGDLKGKETSAQNIPALINYLTGLGILDTGRYIKGGEFDLKARLAKEQKNGS